MSTENELNELMNRLENDGPAMAPMDVLLSIGLCLPLEDIRRMIDGLDWARERVVRLKNMQKVRLCELVIASKIKCREAEWLMHMLFGEGDKNTEELQSFFDALSENEEGEDD
jgi:hypothetical protein